MKKKGSTFKTTPPHLQRVSKSKVEEYKSVKSQFRWVRIFFIILLNIGGIIAIIARIVDYYQHVSKH